MLEIVDENGVENPVESNHNIQDHCNVINPYATERQHFTEKFVLYIWVAQTPVHDQIPDGCIDSVQETESDERCLEASLSVNAVHAQSRVIEDTKDILSQIQEMRESIPGVDVSTNALEGSPYRWQGGEKAQES